MFRLRPAALLLLSLLPLAPGLAQEDPRYHAVAELGALNGIALQCRYLDEMRRMKAAVVASAPKERSFGLAFDQATEAAYLAQFQDKRFTEGLKLVQPGRADRDNEIDSITGATMTTDAFIKILNENIRKSVPAIAEGEGR